MSKNDTPSTHEDQQHAAVMRVLASHFGHSAVDADMEDAAWSILSALDDLEAGAK